MSGAPFSSGPKLHPGTRSHWMNALTSVRTREGEALDPRAILEREALKQNASAQVCIIGAGLAGMLNALALSREGFSVIVLDDGPIASGETGNTTAHLSNAIDDRYYEMEKDHGERGSRTQAESHTAAIDLLESIAAEIDIDCEFRRIPGYLFLPPGGKREELEKELKAAHRAGLTGLRLLDAVPGSPQLGPCLEFPHQAQYHPLKFIMGVARLLDRRGDVRICTGTHASDIKPGSDDKPAKVLTSSGYTVECDHLVVATNSPVNDWVKMHTKQSAWRTYAMSIRIPPGAIEPALLWDTYESDEKTDSYHYIRLSSSGAQDASGRAQLDLMIVGGGDHRTGHPEDETPERWTELESWARERWPMLGEAVNRWSGQVMEPADGVAFIGRNPGDKNIYIVTGDSGMGMTHTAMSSIIIPDLIAQRENPWAELYDPARKVVHGAGQFIKDQAHVAAHYGDWLTGGGGGKVEDLKAEEGRIIRRGLKLLAVHRDKQGELHACNAACTHLGCVVKWNGVEKSWDCPCHGSRFDACGKVLNGPAIAALKPEEVPGRSGESRTEVEAGHAAAAGRERTADQPGRTAQREDRTGMALDGVAEREVGSTPAERSAVERREARGS